jgi:hypothetical protein
LAEQRKTIIDEMAANSLQVEEKTKLTLQSQKEKYQINIERLEKENAELKVRIYHFYRLIFNKFERIFTITEIFLDYYG